MKNNIRLSILLSALAGFVAGVGFESPAPIEDAAASQKTTWANAFPVAQAGFAHPAPAAGKS